MALRAAFDDASRGERVAAILALVGFVNVPIIKFSVEWWSTLHQPSSLVRLDGPSIDPSMLWPLLIMILAFTFYFVTVLLLRVRSELAAQRLRAARLARLGP
jgi:heme exporter protein C